MLALVTLLLKQTTLKRRTTLASALVAGGMLVFALPWTRVLSGGRKEWLAVADRYTYQLPSRFQTLVQ